ncbi:D-tyrosyl-tRNA(tyr) deacylase [Plakobranchus ocellatus]|uniref:D-aminoacyl-tRNA deacylase n=1 Tax=Plakobranchus ocellatus TaxID=259542 RepID=A0AAV4AI83_9GAST|nr:D-tyrosyl-tRNA(tyr) deacylase [Plakobranchus ocellatus]
MKALIQRVAKASVTVGDRTVGSIGHGLCVLVGIHRNDTDAEMEYIVRKILNLRLFSDGEDKKWMNSVVDMDYEVLCVSQFTLESTLKGNKPDFREAMVSEKSKAFYGKFLEALKSQYKPEKIQDGEFGSYMQVHIQNDGPVTIPIEKKPTKPDSGKANSKSNDASGQAAVCQGDNS